MASELRVDTLKDSSGNNSVGMSYVAGGSSKAWVNFNGTGTPAARDSNNFSSITDNATGQYTLAVTSSMSDGNWSSSTLTNAYNGTGNADGHGDSHINNRTASGGYFISVDSANSYADAAVNDWQIFGDLA